MSRVVQVANFVTPTSGGLRTAMYALAEGYAAAGHDVVQVVPGPDDAVVDMPWGRQVHLRAPLVPGTGYRLVLEPARAARRVERLAPDRLEVHDRTTLRGLGRWARAAGVPSLVVSHERLDRLLEEWLPAGVRARRWADRSNHALAARFDAVACTTDWAAEEFVRLGAAVDVVPLGVDLRAFRPDASARPHLCRDGEVLVVVASRLSREKRPGLAVGAVAELRRRGVPARLVVAGHGPLRDRLERSAAGLPVTFLGHLDGPSALAPVLGAADVVLAPGPVETFGLAALEALACGTPVVANRRSALPGVLGRAGQAADGTACALADAVEQVLVRDERARRACARARAEQFPWSAAVEGFCAVHGVTAPPARGAAGAVG